MNVENYIVNHDLSIIDVLGKLDSCAKKILFICNEKKQLVAAITDGDVRRWILKNGDLSASVDKIANFNPKYIFDADIIKAKNYMLKNSISALPVLNADKTIKTIVFWTDNDIDLKIKNKINLPVVIMAGGKGTRLYPYTKILPKPLIPIGDIPIIERIIEQFVKAGCIDFYVIVNYKKDMIKAYFNEIKGKNYSITFIDENIPLGTGGGLKLLQNYLHTDFILTNCDILIKADFCDIIKQHINKKNIVTMICSAKKFTIPYGIVELDKNENIIEMKEKPTLNFLTNTGCYVVNSSVFDYITDNENIGFPDIIGRIKDDNKKVGIYPIHEDAWLDMGQFDELERMEKNLKI